MSNPRKKHSGHKQARAILRPYDLVPEEFREEITARRVQGAWILTLSLLVTVCGNLLFTSWVKMEAERRYAALIRERVEPVLKARDAATAQRDLNERHERWLQHVETARPDDGLLQTLVAIATAAQPHSHEMTFESIEVQLPTEFAVGDAPADQFAWAAAPEQAKPLVIVRLRGPDLSIADSLLERFQAQPRLQEVKIGHRDPTAQPPLLELQALPRATRTLP